MLNPFVILGSMRNPGETSKAIELVMNGHPMTLMDLNTLQISYYDHDHKNQNDDFLPLMEQAVKHEILVLGTPVYWYTMSAIMKNFIDRFSDVLTIRKDLGRSLIGKKLFVVTSYANEFPQGFEEPFRQTCDYMQMKYGGCYYYYAGKDSALIAQNIASAEAFRARLFSLHPSQPKQAQA